MTLEECYARMGADYGEILRRMGNEDRVRRFLQKFPADGSFPLLCESMASGDAKEAFRAAHSLKGICMNLGLEALHCSSAALADALRGGSIPPEAGPLLERVRADYDDCVRLIGALG